VNNTLPHTNLLLASHHVETAADVMKARSIRVPP
jgi:hypothetical protein